MKCFVCKKELTGTNFSHIFKCCKENISKDEMKIRLILFNYPIDLNEFRHLYAEKRFSFPELYEKYGISYHFIDFIIKYLGLKKRSLAEAVRDKKTKNKRIATCQKIYGANNCLSKDTEPYKKRNATVKSRYNVNNVFQLEEVIKKIEETHLRKYGKKRLNNPEKISKARLAFDEEKKKEILDKFYLTIANRSPEKKSEVLENYKRFWKGLTKAQKIELSKNRKEGREKWWNGLSEELKTHFTQRVSERIKKWWKESSEEDKKNWKIKQKESRIKWWNSLTDEQKNEFFTNHYRRSPNKLESKIESALKLCGISYTWSCYINRKQYDFKIGKTVLEIQGDFWHANPEIYKKDDILPFPEGPKKAEDIWEKDLEKKINAEKYGYSIIYLWEKEIKKLKMEQILELLKGKFANECVQN